jgi:hypothetical protein
VVLFSCFYLFIFKSNLLLRFYMPIYCSRMSQGIIRVEINFINFSNNLVKST